MRLRQFSQKGTIVPGVILGLVIGLAVAAFIAWTWNREPSYNEKVRSDMERVRAEREREGRTPQSGDKPASAPSEQIGSDATKGDATKEGNKTATTAQNPKKTKEDLSPQDRERFDFYKILPGIEEARPMTEEDNKKESGKSGTSGDSKEDLIENRQAQGKNKDNKESAKSKRTPQDEDQLNSVMKKLQEEGEVNDREAPRASKPQRWLVQVGAFENEDDADRLKADLAMAGLEARVHRSKDAKDRVIYRVRLGPVSGEDELNRVRSDLKQQGIKSTSIPLH
ncbi:MAG: SPOR domain-containing protein [Pseudomonadota bacterium]